MKLWLDLSRGRQRLKSLILIHFVIKLNQTLSSKSLPTRKKVMGNNFSLLKCKKYWPVKHVGESKAYCKTRIKTSCMLKKE